MRTGPLVVLLSLAAACGDPDPGPRPASPAADDPAFTVRGARAWSLIGNAATPGDDTFVLTVTAPAGTGYVDVWVDDAPGQRLRAASGQFQLALDVGDLPAGEHTLVLGADGAATGFAARTFVRSHPYYVVMTTDWDFPDPSTPALTRQDQLHREHPDLKITHFVGPYTFTDPDMTPARQAELVAWLTRQVDEHDDEIGLHIHPYCSFVEYAGLTCNTEASTVYAYDLSGYTILLSAYDEAEVGAMLVAADELFTANGLPLPRTFRAGGWTASAATLRALDAHGYVADTSALNWARLEEWEGEGTGVLYEWNMANWTPIGDTSQPYYPNVDDALSSAAPTLGLLQVPDNGIMVDYVDTAEMIEIFEANWDGGALAAPTTLVVGYHPAPGFTSTEGWRASGICDHAELHLAARDLGPVVYATLSEVATAFAPAP
ncbi:MAG: hypothetical protein R2939_15870 [Kofleriaceae bacterium]